MSDINVTPFVDVMLVMLVVFMVATPLLPTGVDVNLPEAPAKQVGTDRKPIEVSLDASGQLYVRQAPVDREELPALLRHLVEAEGDPTEVRIFVRADRSLPYGEVMQVVTQIGGAGFSKVAFLSEPPASSEHEDDR